MMLRPSSGSFTARRAFFTVSGLGGALDGSVTSAAMREQWAFPPCRSMRSGPDHQVRQRGAERAQGGDRMSGPRLQASIGEKDDEEIADRIDPEHGAGPPAVPERVRTGQPTVDRWRGPVLFRSVPP